MSFFHDDRAYMTNIEIKNNRYRLTLNQVGEDAPFHFDVTSVCPELAKIARRIEEERIEVGYTDDLCVYVEVLDSELYDNNENKGYAICASSEEPL